MMAHFELLLQNSTYLLTLVGLFSLLIGSFLNVVISRLPMMMERQWREECQHYLNPAKSDATNSAPEEPFNLSHPRSRCPHCNTQIRAIDNIPLLSYIWLRGRCRHCGASIAMQYPLIELLTALLSIAVAAHFGAEWQTLLALLFTWSLISLSVIDLNHTLLPDSISLPLLWLGLLFNLTSAGYVPIEEAVTGAAIGYLSLWSIYWLFKLLTGKEGMGYGDFKLLAAIGAWLGWQALPGVILISSLVGALIGIGLILFKQHQREVPIPFGPYLAIAGWISLLWGEQISHFYLTLGR